VTAAVRLSETDLPVVPAPRLQAQQDDRLVPVQPGGPPTGQGAPPEDRLPGTYPRPLTAWAASNGRGRRSVGR